MHHGRKSGNMERHAGAHGLLDYRDAISKAINNDPRWTVDDLLLKIVHGTMQLFIEGEGIAITEILVNRDRRLLVFLLGGQNIQSWKVQMNAKLVEFAKAQKCSCIEAYCRPGLEKIMVDFGWKREQVVMRLKL